MELVELNSTVNPFLLLPFFVVIRMAPYCARLPYNAAAAGPFNTVYDSTSSGLIFQVSVLMGIPSTTYRVISLPRNNTVGLRSNSAEGPTDKPATFPAKPVTGF